MQTDTSSDRVDELKPPFPYVGGAQLRIRRHVPPLPFGSRHYTGPEPRKPLPSNIYTRFQDQYKTPSRLCLAHPPLETPPHPKQTVHTLKILDQIACGDTRGPQVVTCRINRQEVVRVAKIFDPLYYDFEDDFDPTYYADSHYSAEATAYSKIHEKGLDGKFTPKYEGSFTFDMPLLDGQHRPVRMVLMEYIPHPTVKALIDTGSMEAIPAELRLRALVRATEAIVWLEYNGITHNDFFPRNVLINYDQTPGEIHAVIIDFSHARLKDLPNSRWSTFPPGHPLHKTRPRSPIEKWLFSWGEFEQWIPSNLRGNKNRAEWLMSQWGNSSEFEPPKRLPGTRYPDEGAKASDEEHG